MRRISFAGRRIAAALVLAAASSGSLHSQCFPTPLPGGLDPMTAGMILASALWDPDGAGPLEERLVIGGSFTQIAGVRAPVVWWDRASGTWRAVGPENVALTGEIRAIATRSNGELFVSGQFGQIGNVPASNIARFDGTSWRGVGGGTNGLVECMVRLSDDSIAAGGIFSFAGGAMCGNLARWDGSTWSSLGGSGTNGYVAALAAAPNGALYVGGSFTIAGGQSLPRIARWSGGFWSSLGAGSTNDIYDLAIANDGAVIAGGARQPITGSSLRRWDGAQWGYIGPAGGAGGDVFEVEIASNGDLWIAGDFSTVIGTSTAMYDIARWNGSTWQRQTDVTASAFHNLFTYAPGFQRALLALSNGEIFTALHTRPFPGSTHVDCYPALHDGRAWAFVGSGLRGTTTATIRALAADRTGATIAVGGFATPDGWHVAQRFADGRWQPFARATFGGEYRMLDVFPNGDLLMAGAGASIDGLGSPDMVLWNGTTWSAFPSWGTFPRSPSALAVLQNGNVLAYGINGSLRVFSMWDGFTWWRLAEPDLSTQVDVMFERANGDVVIGGSFTSLLGPAVGTNLVKYSPSTGWNPVTPGGNPNGRVTAIGETIDGALVIAGSFTSVGGVAADGIAMMRGSTWSALGAGITPLGNGVRSIEALPDGGFAIAGEFATRGGIPPHTGLARWSGSTWDAVVGPVNGVVRDLLWKGDHLELGGQFANLGSYSAASYARLYTNCPAAQATIGAGCASSGGANLLSVTSLPWVGGTYRARATGLPTNGFAISLIGLSTVSIPLDAVLLEGRSGCTWHVAMDFLFALPTTAGTAEISAPLPLSYDLVGGQFYHQMLPVELTPGGALLELTATNAERLTIGLF
ncbi:MAG: hypothetical protein JNM84_21985 [Planctomycetes bacterium]|nr:hypothetical protein [Planctomycetota bacterium]